MIVVLFALMTWQIPGLAAAGRLVFGNRVAAALDALAETFTAEAAEPQISFPRELAPSAQEQLAELIREKQARTPEQKKISSQLLYSMKARRGEMATSLRSLRNQARVRDDGFTTVDIRLNVKNPVGVMKRLDPMGAEVINKADGHLRVNAPIDRLEEIAGYEEVVAIRPPAEAITSRAMAPAGSINNALPSAPAPAGVHARAERLRALLGPSLLRMTARSVSPAMMMAINLSEGDATHRAAEARSFFGVDGTGVKIGVLSDGVDSLAQLQAAGDLPASVTVLPGAAGSGNEGAAMLEIVHDLAPGAQLFFATAFGGPAVFAQNIRALRQAGCDIIVDDIIYFVESPFQDGQAANVVSPTNGGIIAQAVRDVTADGALYFSSAGNEGNVNDGTSGTWEGNFNGNGPATGVLTSAGTVHNFGDGGVSNLVTATSVRLVLHWSDPLGASGNDYDMYVLNGTMTTIFDAGTDTQDGNDDPVELAGQAFTGERIVVVKFSGADRYIRLENFRGRLTLNTPGATYGHSSVAAAFAVAATPAADPFGAPPNPTGPFPGPHSASDTVERFSADGPRQLFFNPDSTAITPGNVLAGGGESRQKPDITAADGVSCAAPGFNPFFGTSAAAPHAAAIAGLLLSANPSLTPAQVRTALVTSALDIEAPGVDRDSGAGIVMAFQALQAIGATPQVNLKLGVVTPTLTCDDGDAMLEPCEGATLSVQLDNIGGVTATGVSAVLTTTTPGVTIDAGQSAYPDIAPQSDAANTTPFSFTINCSVACGTKIEFELAVSYTGGAGPEVFTFSLNTGNPDAPQTFSYAGPVVPIPDGTGLTGTQPGAPALATIQVSGLSRIGDLNFRFDGSSCTAAVGATTVGLDHSFVNDLVIKLTSPQGTTVTLIEHTDGGGNNFCQTVLDDDANAPSIQGVTTAQAPFTGTFAPADSLSAFDGEDPNGTWTLSVQDFFGADTGRLRAFSLVITPLVCDATGCAEADLSITKTVSQTAVVVGQPVTYTITVTNDGPSAASNVVVTDILPPQVAFVSCSAPPDGVCGGSGNNRTITFASIPNGESRTITLVATALSTGSFTNTATVVSDTPDPTMDDLSATSAAVQAFDICIQDDSNSSNVALVDSTTGAYQFCCNGNVVQGIGTLLKKGNTVTITHNTTDRAVLIRFEGAVKRGTGSLKVGGRICTITDRNTSNNTCACAAPIN